MSGLLITCFSEIMLISPNYDLRILFAHMSEVAQPENPQPEAEERDDKASIGEQSPDQPSTEPEGSHEAHVDSQETHVSAVEVSSESSSEHAAASSDSHGESTE